MLSCFNLVWLFVTLWAIAHQVPLSMRFSRQEYWSGLLFPSLRDLPDSGIEPEFPMSPALAGWPFTTSSYIWQKYLQICLYIYMCVCVCIHIYIYMYIYKTKSIRRQQAILFLRNEQKTWTNLQINSGRRRHEKFLGINSHQGSADLNHRLQLYTHEKG